jgi:hypothetical protein
LAVVIEAVRRLVTASHNQTRSKEQLHSSSEANVSLSAPSFNVLDLLQNPTLEPAGLSEISHAAKRYFGANTFSRGNTGDEMLTKMGCKFKARSELSRDLEVSQESLLKSHALLPWDSLLELLVQRGAKHAGDGFNTINELKSRAITRELKSTWEARSQELAKRLHKVMLA